MPEMLFIKCKLMRPHTTGSNKRLIKAHTAGPDPLVTGANRTAQTGSCRKSAALKSHQEAENHQNEYFSICISVD